MVKEVKHERVLQRLFESIIGDLSASDLAFLLKCGRPDRGTGVYAFDTKTRSARELKAWANRLRWRFYFEQEGVKPNPHFRPQSRTQSASRKPFFKPRSARVAAFHARGGAGAISPI